MFRSLEFGVNNLQPSIAHVCKSCFVVFPSSVSTALIILVYSFLFKHYPLLRSAAALALLRKFL